MLVFVYQTMVSKMFHLSILFQLLKVRLIICMDLIHKQHLGGRHVDVIMEQISKKLEESVNKKNKGGMKVKAHQIKQHCWLFVKAQARFISLYDSSLMTHQL